MALSPIQMFQSNQSSLAQLLQGGNQTISGIMDQAIQVGRDMSNKQLAQERDMLGMRQQETAMAQRRAENLQQNNEDAQRFARSAFESDRRYGADQAQQGVQNARQATQDTRQATQDTRQATQDLFQQSNSDRNYGLSERNVDISEGGLKLRQDEISAKQRAEQANREYFQGKYGNSTQQSQADPGVASMLSPDGSSPATNNSVTKLYQNVTELENDLDTATDPALRAQISSQIGNAKGQIAQIPRPRAASTPQTADEAELKQLQLVEARRKGVNAGVEDIVSNNPDSFPAPASSFDEDLRILATSTGKKPEDVLYSSAFPADKRKAILAAQAEQKIIEYNAVNQASSEDAYVKLHTEATEAQKENRRLLYRTARRKNATSAPTSAAPQAMTPKEAAQFELDELRRTNNAR